MAVRLVRAKARKRGISMKRNVSLDEISDGRLYGENDMVKADCHGCSGCCLCCRGMGNSVILDPYDVYRLQAGLGKTLSCLLEEGAVELNVVDGIILPNLRMCGEEEQCYFLDGEGRCGIHPSRPGICRLFPLGRFYEKGDFKYFLQTGECDSGCRSKVKVAKWIDTPNPGQNHRFVCDWHYLLKDLEERTAGAEDLEESKRLNLALLGTFFLQPYDAGHDFYEQFQARRKSFCDVGAERP